MASIVKRGNSYSVVYYLKENNVKKQKWETYHSESEALRRKVIVEKYLRIQKEKQCTQISNIEQLLYEYIRLYGKTKWSLSMYTTSCSLIRNYIIPNFGNIRLSEISPRLISELYSDFLSYNRYCDKFHKHENKRVTESTLKKIHKLLHSAFEQAVLWELVERNPFHKATLPKNNTVKTTFLLPEQITFILSHCDDYKIKICIELAFACTLRRGEILALTWDDIDLEQKIINMNKTLNQVGHEALEELNNRDVLHIFNANKDCSNFIVLKKPKTESSNRIVYLSDTLSKSLLTLKNMQKNTAYGNNPKLIFAYEDGRPLQGSVLSKKFHKLLERCKLPKVTFHSLRHSSITYKLMLTGGDIKAVQGDSGHAQAGMITELYGHILDKNRKYYAKKFENSFFEKQETNI